MIVESDGRAEPDELGDDVIRLINEKGIEGAEDTIYRYVDEHAGARDKVIAILEKYAAEKGEKGAAKAATRLAESIRALTMLEMLKGVEQ